MTGPHSHGQDASSAVAPHLGPRLWERVAALAAYQNAPEYRCLLRSGIRESNPHEELRTGPERSRLLGFGHVWFAQIRSD